MAKETRKKNPRLEVEAFEVYERIRPVLEEYLDDWILVGRRAGCKTKIMLGSPRRNGVADWGDMNCIYETIQEWKKKSHGGA